MQPDQHQRLIPEQSQPHIDTDPPTGRMDFLTKIRREFPNWGILAGYDGMPWRAVLGRKREITAVDGITLRESLLAATQHDRRLR
jgi:hypothetical protein